MTRPLPAWIRSNRRAAVAVAAVTLACALAGIFTLPVMDRDEARFAQASAQMLASGDLIEIRFLDEARNKKPIGIYWMQAASVWLTSSESAREIWAYRLPSVLGAVLAALAAFLAGTRLVGREAGLAAGLMFGASVLLGAEAGLAKTDAMLAATSAWAFYALAGLRTASDARETKRFSLLFWSALGVGVLIKGPITPMVGALAVAALIVWERRIDWARPLAWWPGPLIGLVIVAPWFAAVQIATDGAFLREALGQDVGPKLISAQEDHGAPPGYHLAFLSVLFLPAIAALPAGVRAAVSEVRGGGALGPAMRLILAFALPSWLVFEILPTKLPHYVLPVYPALAVLAGLGFARLTQTPAIWRWLGAGLLMFGAVVAGPGVAVFAHVFGATPVPLAIGFAVIIVALSAVTALATGLARPQALLILAVVTGFVWQASGRGVLLPASQDFFISRDTARAALALSQRAPTGGIVSTFTEPSLVFTLGGAVTLSDPADLITTPVDPAAPRTYIIDQSRWLRSDAGPVSETEQAARTAWLGALAAASCETRALEGVNYSRGDDPTPVFIHVTGCTPAE